MVARALVGDKAARLALEIKSYDDADDLTDEETASEVVKMSGADFLRPAAKGGRQQERRKVVYGVWCTNWLAYRVFVMCRFDESVGFGAVAQGVSAVEAEAVCNGMRIVGDEREATLEKVRFMSIEACNYLNEQRANKAKSKS